MTPLLVAGIGNIFKGDDGFGVAVAERLASHRLPPGTQVVDFGIRALDLVYALTGGCGAAILVDAVQRGHRPGTIYVIEPELAELDDTQDQVLLVSPHEMEPEKVLRLVAQLGGGCGRIVLVGCEPESFGDDEFGAVGMTPTVAAAVGRAADTVERLAWELCSEEVTS